jgi:hypothetical protein
MHAWVTLPPLTWKRIQQCMQFIILHMHVNHRYTFSQKKCIHTPVVATVLCPWATVPWTVGRHLILFVWCHLFRPAYLHRSHSHSGTQHTRVVYSSYLSILIITWHYRLLLYYYYRGGLVCVCVCVCVCWNTGRLS